MESCQVQGEPAQRRLESYHVLVGHGQQVALFVGQVLVLLRHQLHGGRHIVVALGLLGHLGALHQVVPVHFAAVDDKACMTVVEVRER